LNSREVTGQFQAFAFPWLTAESFIVRFQATPLYISRILLQAVPTTGVHVADAVSEEDPYA